jgi:SAM-dependent methyltransferase
MAALKSCAQGPFLWRGARSLHPVQASVAALVAAWVWQASRVRMRRGWESEAENWARFSRTPGHDHSHADINLPALLELLPAPGRRTLDLGCGEGRLGPVLRSLGHQVVGIDAAPTMVRLAATRDVPELAVVADAAELPFHDGVFDLVVAYMSLHDIDRMPQAVAQIARVLDRGGRLCLAIVHPLSSAGSFSGKDATAPFVISGSYLDPVPTTWVSDRGGIRMTFHSAHRPIEAYSRALETAGMLIEALREVRINDRPTANDPSERRWMRIPLFLHIRAVKR